MNTVELADGGLLLYAEAFPPPDLAGRYFAELLDATPWEQKTAAFGHLQPRLTAASGDDGRNYKTAQSQAVLKKKFMALYPLKPNVVPCCSAFS